MNPFRQISLINCAAACTSEGATCEFFLINNQNCYLGNGVTQVAGQTFENPEFAKMYTTLENMGNDIGNSIITWIR